MWLLLVTFACTGTADDTAGTASPLAPTCWGDLAVGEVQTLATGFTDGSEGLAFSDGRLFVGTPTQVVELAPDGRPTVVWENDHVLGLAGTDDGLLVADPGEFTFGGDDDGQIWALTLDGTATLVAEGLSNPNFLVPTPWGSTLMADDTVESVVDISLADGSVSTFLADVPSPNGMVLTETSLTVASTFVAEAPVYRAPVSDGQAGTAELLATTVEGGVNDGMAGGWDGSVWVAVNLAGAIWGIDADGVASELTDAVNTPASLAFGEGEDWDPCSLYVTSLFGDTVVRVAVWDG